MLDKLIDKYRKWLCKRRGYHIWVRRTYGGLGGIYSVEKCKCCGVDKEDSFRPIKNFC